jgi:hypothetical protein
VPVLDPPCTVWFQQTALTGRSQADILRQIWKAGINSVWVYLGVASLPRQLPDLKEVAVVDQFITPEEHLALLDWAQGQFSGGHLKANPGGGGRYFSSYKEGDSVPDCCWEVRRRAVSAFSVEEYEDEPRYKCFLGCNTKGGFIHPHRDPSPQGKRHVRMNIMLSKPKKGGYPVIEGKVIEINERDMWCFYPTFMRHESTPVVGVRKRFVLSIGILVPDAEQ